MTKLSDAFQLDLASDDASWACREAVAGMDWDLESVEPCRLVLRRRGTFARDPAKIEVLLSEAGSHATSVRLDAQDPWGLGAVGQAKPPRANEQLRNAIEVAARRSTQR
ncbi:MAG: hypothetical protein ACXVII_30975 [Solirubrobacteraceae bacterium]